MSASPNRAREIFVAGLKLAPDQWPAYLQEACGEDDALRGRVQNLLVAHRDAGSFLEPAAGGLLVTSDEPVSERPGTVIGPYKLLQQIGEGGMGTVFMAEQTQPVQRKVALKIIKPGMDSRQVIARFEAERQALALMDHPNIAKVFDGGTTDSGRPYLATLGPSRLWRRSAPRRPPHRGGLHARNPGAQRRAPGLIGGLGQ
jgi:hypothetical protein